MMIRRGFILGAGAGLAAACAPAREPVVSATAAEAAYPPLGRLYGPDGRRVHATDDGRGDGAPVILIHGASGNVRDWTFDITRRLSTHRRVIAMDRPGFGYSEREGTEGAWRPEAQAAQLREAAREMGAERPVLVGHSWGASVALAWALDAPDDVSGVVSVSGVTMPWGGIAPIFDALGFGPLIAAAYNRRITRTAETGGVERFIARAFQPQDPPKGYLDYVGAPLALREKTLAANGQDLANTNRGVAALAARYGELKVPAEIMHGDADWLLDIEQHGVAFAAAAPNARLTPLPGIGHMAHHAREDVLSELIERVA
ncbi:alpha/beta hydrolase [Pikeienuella piscinae]|uniref:Alpha/beta hydrolase n=1 Tax=Pikeienuella piscinae TaxID=2748098 RepID=A0A7L5BVV6_9RHOB|nr:alpha/beta hydrolase [Pikeienuella piscinae]QIE54004.1 alpha/beta hydrolase [Pikeienuella piscinae]